MTSIHPLKNHLTRPKKGKNVTKDAGIGKSKKKQKGEKKRDRIRKKSVNVDENQKKENRMRQLPRGLYQILMFLILR